MLFFRGCGSLLRYSYNLSLIEHRISQFVGRDLLKIAEPVLRSHVHDSKAFLFFGGQH